VEPPRRISRLGDVAQLVEHRLCKPGVVGSSPIVSTGSGSRARPPGSLVATTGSSFPSGHAVAASVTVVAAVIALFPEGNRRYVLGAVAAVFSLVMALSRAYLGAHWLSDAVAGVLLGTSIALCVALVVHVIRERGLGARNAAPRPVLDEPVAAGTET
jgi:membrane-associated phospholipid phosphatase